MVAAVNTAAVQLPSVRYAVCWNYGGANEQEPMMTSVAAADSTPVEYAVAAAGSTPVEYAVAAAGSTPVEYAVAAAGSTPVEYAVAVDRYLAESGLSQNSRRVYRISLTSWAWPLVGKLPPAGRGRRLASPPVVPLALLDRDDTGRKLAAAVAHRVRHAQARTVNRELSTLRSAIGWWQDRHWIGTDPTATLRQVAGRLVATPPLTGEQRAALFAAPAGLREQALWHLLQDTGAAAETVLALDAGGVDAACGRARSPLGDWLKFGPQAADLLGWLLAGRYVGPVFLTDRRASADATAADVCPLTGRGRMSYRRAAEIFTAWTRSLDPAGRGWTLHQLRQPGLRDLRHPLMRESAGMADARVSSQA
jgi:hypothetical protein